MKSCLIVDDSKVVRTVARKILEDLDFEIVEAADGQAAMDECNRRMPDAILLDWNMPVMDGLAFMKEMRKLPKGAGVKVVFCTTRNELPSVQEALAEGADEYIMKPFDREMLESKFLQVGLL